MTRLLLLAAALLAAQGCAEPGSSWLRLERVPDCLPKVKISRDGRRPDGIFAGAVCDTTALERLVS